MKNLKPYTKDCFSVHKNAVNKKHESEIKTALIGLNPMVALGYKQFLESFENNRLASLSPQSFSIADRNSLISLYNYRSSVITTVREAIRKEQIQTIINTCQNCTIDSANTLDHILPKVTFPEFVVNPKNLFPCCSTCNSYKTDLVASGGTVKFLNLYLDELPDTQYLFLDVFLDKNGEVDFNYYLKNDGTINKELFAIIESHYS